MKKTSREKIKVYFFLPTLNGGGAERVTINILKGIDRNTFSQKLILGNKIGAYIKEVPPYVPVMDLHKKHVRYALLELGKLLRREEPDILFSALGHANLVALMSSFLARNATKVVVSIHTTPSRAALEKRSLKSKLVFRLEPVLYSRADKVVVVSKGVKNDVEECLGLKKEKIALIHNPIVDYKLIKLSHQRINHPWLNNPDISVIISVGRLSEAKDYSTLLKAFRVVRNKLPAKLVILGEGKARRFLENLAEKLNIESHLEMPGFIENPYKYVAKASVFVLSSTREGLPTVLVEAMACGVPVVSTDCPFGPKEIIEQGINGILVPVRNPKLLAEAILKVLRNKDLSTKLIKEEKKRAKDFEINKIVKEYEKLFLNLIRK